MLEQKSRSRKKFSASYKPRNRKTKRRQSVTVTFVGNAVRVHRRHHHQKKMSQPPNDEGRLKFKQRKCAHDKKEKLSTSFKPFPMGINVDDGWRTTTTPTGAIWIFLPTRRRREKILFIYPAPPGVVRTHRAIVDLDRDHLPIQLPNRFPVRLLDSETFRLNRSIANFATIMTKNETQKRSSSMWQTNEKLLDRFGATLLSDK